MNSPTEEDLLLTIEQSNPSDLSREALRAKLGALRHFTAGSPVPQPAHRVDAGLLAGLISLGDEADPYEWLADHHARLGARVLLWDLLQRVLWQLDALSRPRSKPWFTHPRQVIPALAERAQAAPEELLNHLKSISALQPTAVPEEDLVVAVGEFKGLFPESHDLAREGEQEDWWQLLAELLDLPSGSEALDHLEQSYAHPAAYGLLGLLVGEVSLPPVFIKAPALRTLRPNLRQRAGGLTLVLEELKLGSTWFSLSLRTTLPTGWLRRPGQMIPLSPLWRSLDHVSDDAGNRYLVSHYLEGSTYWRGFRCSQLLLCYPAPPPAAKELTLESQGLALEFKQPSEAKEAWEVVRRLDLGDLSWDIPLAR
jgi:hypothetical protein